MGAIGFQKNGGYRFAEKSGGYRFPEKRGQGVTLYYSCILYLTVLLLGLEKFIDTGIPADKLVLGVPWFGNRYRCLALKQVWRVIF